MLKQAVVIIFMSTMLLLAGCAGDRERARRSQTQAPELYEQAQQQIRTQNFPSAVELFERIESRFPFSQEAQQAQLEIVYAHYKAGNHEQALAASERFLREQPRHHDVDYIHYLRGLINFDRSRNFMDALFNIDPARRDPTFTLRSFQSFATLVANHPDSRYVPDATQRMVFLRNQLARHEVHVADYYMRLGAWVAAAARARTVVEQYDATPSAVDGLVILHNAYRRLEMDELADDVARVVALNYPDATRRLRD